MGAEVVFKTDFGCKIYNAYTNEMGDISDDFYNAIIKEKRISEQNDCIKREYGDLEKLGFFSATNIEDISVPMTEEFRVRIERTLSHMVFQVTQNCNLRCSYCTFTNNDGKQRSHVNKNMSYETAKQALDFLWENSIDSKEIKLSFYGGEPFLNYDFIKKVVEYSLEIFQGKEVFFNATTNGTIFNDEILKFLDKYNFSIALSLDGTKEINDLNRKFANSSKGSYDFVAKELFRIYEEYPQLFKKLTVNMVLDPKHDYSLYRKIFKDFPMLDNFQVTANIIDDLMIEEKNQFYNKFLTGYEYDQFLGLLNSAVNEQGKNNLSIASINQLQSKVKQVMEQGTLKSRATPGGPCVPAIKKFFVNVEGNLYPCEKVREPSDCMKIGDVYNGLDYQAMEKQMNIQLLTEKQCKDCWAFRFCESCQMYSDNGDSLDSNVRLSFCKAQKDNAIYKLKFHVVFNHLKNSIKRSKLIDL